MARVEEVTHSSARVRIVLIAFWSLSFGWKGIVVLFICAQESEREERGEDTE